MKWSSCSLEIVPTKIETSAARKRPASSTAETPGSTIGRDSERVDKASPQDDGGGRAYAHGDQFRARILLGLGWHGCLSPRGRLDGRRDGGVRLATLCLAILSGFIDCASAMLPHESGDGLTTADEGFTSSEVFSNPEDYYDRDVNDPGGNPAGGQVFALAESISNPASFKGRAKASVAAPPLSFKEAGSESASFGQLIEVFVVGNGDGATRARYTGSTVLEGFVSAKGGTKGKVDGSISATHSVSIGTAVQASLRGELEQDSGAFAINKVLAGLQSLGLPVDGASEMVLTSIKLTLPTGEKKLSLLPRTYAVIGIQCVDHVTVARSVDVSMSVECSVPFLPVPLGGTVKGELGGTMGGELESEPCGPIPPGPEDDPEPEQGGGQGPLTGGPPFPRPGPGAPSSPRGPNTGGPAVPGVGPAPPSKAGPDDDGPTTGGGYWPGPGPGPLTGSGASR